MYDVEGAGCWPDRAAGTVHWLPAVREWSRTPPADRVAEVLRLRVELGRALEDLEGWSESQGTLGARLLLTTYREALLEDGWRRRTCALVESGLPAAAAAVDAADWAAGVLSRSEPLRERAAGLVQVGRWIAGRLEPLAVPEGAILAAGALSVLDVLQSRHPLLTAGDDPGVTGRGPLVWGVQGLGPDWDGRRVTILDARISLESTDPVPVQDPPVNPGPPWWDLRDDQLHGIPVCRLGGDLAYIKQMAHKLGRLPAVLVRRLDDLAAIPLYVNDIAAVAVDLDALVPASRLKHPGLELLLRAAVQAAQAADVPLVAGGRAVRAHPDRWLKLGLTGFFGPTPTRRG